MVFTKTEFHSTICGSCPLKSRRLCRAVLEHFNNSGQRFTPRIRAIEAETRLQEEDERPQFSGILRKGYLRTERILQDGRRSVLSFLAPGDLIGDAVGSVRGPALVTASNVEICAFDPVALRRTLQNASRLHTHFLSEAMKQHSRQLEMVWRRGALNSRERIVAFLVLAAEFMPIDPQPDGSVILNMKVSRKDWADFSNTTVETICRTLAYLTEKDMVETVAPSHYRIRDLGILAQLAGLDSLYDRSAMRVEGSSHGAGLTQTQVHVQSKMRHIKPERTTRAPNIDSNVLDPLSKASVSPE